MNSIETSKVSRVYNFNYGWKFKLANAFPLKAALDNNKDTNGRYFYESDFIEKNWETVGVPHTFNAHELFSKRMEDAGAGQTRTFAFYRKKFDISEKDKGKKIIIEFEGIRQSCFLYVNGVLAGFYENGVAPFGFDITAYIKFGCENLIAVANDNTCTRNADFCMAETPNKPDVEPGSYIAELTKGSVPKDRQGVGYFWNCNDFNPALGGLTKNIRLHIKSDIYLTLPLYTNLQTKGIYIFADKFDIKNKTAEIHICAEIRNESIADKSVKIESIIVDMHNKEIARISSDTINVKRAELPKLPPLTITPSDAYVKVGECYESINDENAVAPTITESLEVAEIEIFQTVHGLNFWGIDNPYQYSVYTNLIVDGKIVDTVKTETGFRKVEYSGETGLIINNENIWLTGYAQRAANEWAAVGAASDWLKDYDASLIRESNANHIRWMHVAACPADIRSCDRYGIVCTQPAGDKERENFGRQWDQRVELMRDVIVYFRNSPSIVFWEVGNNAVNKEHMQEMRLLKNLIDSNGGRYIGCRTLSTEDVVCEAEYVGTMLNRHAGRFQSEKMPVTETEYSREESPRRVWDDFSPPDFDYDNKWVGRGGRKELGRDVHDLTAEDFALVSTGAYSEFFNDRVGGASGKNLYSAAAALCWTDSVQHGRQSGSENARMSGRVDGVRVKKQNFDVYRVMQSNKPCIKIIGHWNYPEIGGDNYKYPIKEFDGDYWKKTGEYAYRNPKEKTVYVAASYDIAYIELFVNGNTMGKSEKPINSFMFKFDNIDVTQNGYIYAKAYDYDGNLAAEDRIDTVGTPKKIKIIPHTGEKGLLADGTDTAYFDIEVVDENDRICPLCYDRIDFDINGEGVFLGGYNSGKYNGYGKNDSVIHKNHVYAECGTNRVFIKSTVNAGKIVLTAKMKGIENTSVSIESKIADISPMCNDFPQRMNYDYEKIRDNCTCVYTKNERADKVKYTPDTKVYCKVLVNADEADTHGVRVEYDHGAVWGPIMYILERIKRAKSDILDFSYNANEKTLKMVSGKNTVIMRVGHTHMIVNGEENLLNGEPEIINDIFIAEISAIVPFIDGVKVYYDENVNLYRVIFD